jgi:putative transcription antitermination factor YqgF
MRYLGIDFGLRNIGLSFAEGPLAEPLTQKQYQSLDELLKFLQRLVQEQQINTIIIGLPEGQLASQIKEFSQKLKSLTNLPIHYQDETLSTQTAKQKLIQAQAPQKKRRQDHLAAATQILQSYLDDQPKA